MDSFFMDKISDKMTAQEMMDVNAQAEVEERKRLEDQVNEYRRCLDRLESLLNQNLKPDTSNVEHIVREGMDKISKNNSILERQIAQVVELVEERMSRSADPALNRAADGEGGAEGDAEGAVEADDAATGAYAQGGKIAGDLDERLREVSDGVHKECVKVYRNVQASVIDENTKQTETLATDIASGKKAVGKVYVVAVMALLFSLASLVLQILSVLHIL